MDFELTDEQRLLRESVERLMADRYDFAARRRFGQEASGFGAEMWRQFMHSLNTPPASAFRNPESRIRTTRQYRQLRAAEPPRSK